MKFRQEFSVAQPADRLWAFFEQPQRVAACIPGVEEVTATDDDTLNVRASQKLGPMSATFDARVRVTERVAGERLAFTSTGKAVRGAMGNFRATNQVLLRPEQDGTHVVVEGEAVLAGMLGSVGQKVISRQAEKVTAEFARNLAEALAGDTRQPDRTAEPVRPVPRPLAAAPIPPVAAPPVPAAGTNDLWIKAAAILSGTATLVGLVILWHCAGQ